METHKDQVVDVAAPIMGVSPALAGRAYDELMPTFSRDGKFDVEALKVLARSYVEMDLLPKEPDMSDAHHREIPAGRTGHELGPIPRAFPRARLRWARGGGRSRRPRPRRQAAEGRDRKHRKHREHDEGDAEVGGGERRIGGDARDVGEVDGDRGEARSPTPLVDCCTMLEKLVAALICVRRDVGIGQRIERGELQRTEKAADRQQRRT